MRPIELTYYRKGKFTKRTTEYLFIDDQANLMQAGMEFVKSMNRKNEFLSPMILCGIKEYTPPDPKITGNHQWVLASSAKMIDNGNGEYRLITCKKCGMKGRQYTNRVLPSIDLHDVRKRFSKRKKNLDVCCERLLKGYKEPEIKEIYGIPVAV